MIYILAFIIGIYITTSVAAEIFLCEYKRKEPLKNRVVDFILFPAVIAWLVVMAMWLILKSKVAKWLA